jgi:hypothetical protein
VRLFVRSSPLAVPVFVTCVVVWIVCAFAILGKICWALGAFK